MKKKLPIFLIIVVGLAIGIALWWTTSLAPVNPASRSDTAFVISKGDEVRDIARKLHDQGLIRDQIAFFLLIKKLGIEKNIQAGTFQISPSQSASEIALALTKGTDDMRITVIEGLRSEEILEQLRSQITATVAGSTDVTVKDWKADEGKLFPDTYVVPKEITLPDFRALMLKNFAIKFTSQMQTDVAKNGLTEDQTIVLASLLEREGRTPQEKAMIADILLKRLKSGQSLDIDATVQYVLGKQPNGSWWKKDLTLDDLKVASPYNTYQNAGLPPAPICNPGLSSLTAAVYPTANPYYYYLHDKNGGIHYATTLEEHNANVAKYL